MISVTAAPLTRQYLQCNWQIEQVDDFSHCRSVVFGSLCPMHQLYDNQQITELVLFARPWSLPGFLVEQIPCLAPVLHTAQVVRSFSRVRTCLMMSTTTQASERVFRPPPRLGILLLILQPEPAGRLRGSGVWHLPDGDESIVRFALTPRHPSTSALPVEPERIRSDLATFGDNPNEGTGNSALVSSIGRPARSASGSGGGCANSEVCASVWVNERASE